LVALKELNRDRFSTHQFLRELRFLLSLQHPNIVTCQTSEHTATGRCLVMDYCEGGTLRHLLSEEMQLHPLQGLQLIVQILAGLDHAHQRDIVHCDIKPENILLTATTTGWTARITDFGIARFNQELSTEEFSNTGSPAYMAPERFYGQHSPASDLYAVGILLFEVLTGSRPFSGLPADLMAAHLNQTLRLPETIPEAICPVISKALQKLPARRFRSAAEMLNALQAAIAACEQSLTQGWQSNILQRSLATPNSTAFRADYQETLQAPIQQLASLQNDRPEVICSTLAKPSTELSQAIAQPLYRVVHNQIGCQWLNHSKLSPIATIRLPEPILQMAIFGEGCFGVTQQAVYRLPAEAFRAIAEQRSGQQVTPQLIATLKPGALLTIEPGGRWMAMTVPLVDKTQGQLNIWNLQNLQPQNLQPFKPAIALSIQPCFQLLALDSRYGAALSAITNTRNHTRIVGTQIELFTRRGTAVGFLRLSIPLRHLCLTQTRYRLLALEPGYPYSLVLLDLKPLRIERIGLKLVPKFLASTSWGYLIMDAQGQMMLINRLGQEIGQIQGPAHPTVMALFNSYQVAIATWNGTEGTLAIVDLRQLDLDLVF
jgi:serine/threonine-protein kinase